MPMSADVPTQATPVHSVLDYGVTPNSRRRLWSQVPRMPALPRRVIIAAACVSVLCALAGWAMKGHFIAIRDYEPQWKRQVSPVAAPLGTLFGFIGLCRARESGRRVLWPLGAAGLVASAWCSTLLVFSPRLIVCGESAERVRCASHLRQIGQGLQMYAAAHGGAYPPDLGTLYLSPDGLLPPETFVCPESHDGPARGVDKKTTAELLKKNHHCSYVYTGAGFTRAAPPAGAVVAIEYQTNHGDHGVNVLFGDGRVEFWPTRNAKALLAELAAGQNPPRAEVVK